MKLFTRQKQDELISLRNELDDILKQAPLLIKNQEEKSEIINLTTSRELNHLKKRMWKFYHK